MNEDIVSRARQFFERRIAHLEGMMKDLKSLPAELTEDDIDRIADQQDEHRRLTEEMD